MTCSIPKLLHPSLREYLPYVETCAMEKKELLSFLGMVRLKQRKLRRAFREKEKGAKNKELAELVGVKVRRFQQLWAEYQKTGILPKLNPNRRPKKELDEDEMELIRTAVRESNMRGANALRLYLKKYYRVNIGHNKIHAFLISEGIAKEDPKKKKQRKYCRYEREHSFSLVHLDWHESDAIPGKQVCVVEDDASRLILVGDEFDNALEENNLRLMKEAVDGAESEYGATIREVNTDRGCQFYANCNDARGHRGEAEFEGLLRDLGIKHILSRRNHPQTNGKEERWFRTYEENRLKFASFEAFVKWYNDRIHLGLSRREGITPNEAVISRLQPECLLGLFYKGVECDGIRGKSI